MKRIEISYNPYTNRIHFRQELTKDGSEEPFLAEIESDSQLLKFQRNRCIFENCVEEILDIINKYFNTSGSLTIDFLGTAEDFTVLKAAIAHSENPKSKGIVCDLVDRYSSSSDALQTIRDSYEKIKSEFIDYIENDDLDKDDERVIIGHSIEKFQDAVRAEIPVCVIGNYSVGKSALVNALIGYEILPSHANSTTAKNVYIRNDQSYSLSFEYKGAHYTISLTGNNHSVQCDEDEDEVLIDELFNQTYHLESEEQILHQIIENLNIETGGNSHISEIKDSVTISVPFRNSELDTERYSFVFIDTPGSNNGDEAQRIHRQNLEELMDKQTNALPIFVMGRNSLDSNDANDLRTLLENKESGFSLQNCIIAISMADLLVEQQLSEEMPEKIKQWLNHPTIMFVSPIAAIGEKKIDKGKWIDQAYRQIYEKKLTDLTELMPPSYNETPCGRKISNERRASIPSLLFASGIPSLETEINYYAYRFAEYKKCTKGQGYLLTALELADKKLQEAKIQLEKDKKKKEKEQQAVRAKLIKKIDEVPLPAVNAVISDVKKEFNAALENYCTGIESLVRATWDKYKDKDNAMDKFEKAMTEHCQANLYDAHIKDIKSKIELKYVELIRRYMESVKQCVTEEYNKISDGAQKELESIFAENTSGPQLKDVPVGLFERIKLSFLGKLPFDWAKERVIRNYTRIFKETIGGTYNKIGSFANQCIREPAIKYSKQIAGWSIEYKKSIDATLNKENAILSDLDEKIKTMIVKIEDMERRLNNLSNVKAVLGSVLPNDMEAKNE
jgi:predicted GTPase